MQGVRVNIHDDLLPDGITSEDICDALTVDTGNCELLPAGTRDTIAEQSRFLDALRCERDSLQTKLYEAEPERENTDFWRGELRKIARVMEGVNHWVEGSRLETAVQILVEDTAKLAAERDEARDAANDATYLANVAFKLRDTMATENTRLQEALAHVRHVLKQTTHSHARAGVKIIDDVLPLPFTGNTDSDHAPPDGDVSEPRLDAGGLSPQVRE